MPLKHPKKVKLSVHNRRTKWAPIWAVIKKFGAGKARRTHPSAITKHRRHWRRTKLRIKPRIARKQQLG